MSRLFTPLTLRSVTLRNRIGVSPMCQYSSQDGCATDWHLVHLGSRAVGGAGLIVVEATAVTPQGRISPDDSGLWNQAQAAAFAPICNFIREQGGVPAIQLAHAGRKASTDVPWRGGAPILAGGYGWTPCAPSATHFAPGYPIPSELDEAGLDQIRAAFVAAAERAVQAGFRIVEIHMAHGYLLHEFLSPLANHRSDAYGGTLENRLRFPLEIAAGVRRAWPEDFPLLVRISATDWVADGWDLHQALILAERLKGLGVDLIDCSSGGIVPEPDVPVAPGYQVPFSATIREAIGIPTAAVGMITDPAQAAQIVTNDEADLVLLGRQALRDPYWPLHAARQLGVDVPWPNPYLRAKN